MLNTFEAKLGDFHYPIRSAHAGGRALGRENSLQAVRRSAACTDIDAIEVDVRKSRDGVLYCHHGSVPFGATLVQIFRYLTFLQIQKLTGPLDTLATISEAIPERLGFYLDI